MLAEPLHYRDTIEPLHYRDKTLERSMWGAQERRGQGGLDGRGRRGARQGGTRKIQN